MRSIWLIWMASSTLILHAQIDFTRADVYKVGDTAQFYGLDATNAEPGPAGNGVTWDFSNLQRQADEDFVVRYGAPSEAPNGDQFPDANMVAIQDAGQGFTAYTFIKANDNEIQLEGLDIPDLGVVTYSDKNLWLKFPFGFNETQSDPFVGTYIFNVQGISGIANRDGELSTVYDGFGTIILPDGTRVENVRRLKLDQTVNDVVSVSGFNITTKVETTTYHWFAQDERLQVFTLTLAKSTVTPPGMTVDSKSANYRVPSGNPTPTVAKKLGAHLTTQGGAFDTEIIIRNTSDSDKTIKLQPYDETGMELTAVDVNLGPDTISRVLQQDYFPTNARSFSASGCDDCNFSTGYRAAQDNPSTAQVHQIQDFRDTFYFYPGEWEALFDGAAIVNAGDESADILATQYDSQGNVLTMQTLAASLAPDAKHLVLFNDVLVDNPDSIVELSSDQPMGVMILRISQDFRFLYQNATIPAKVDNDAGRWLAHITSDSGGFSTDLIFHNQADSNETVQLIPYTADGMQLTPVNRTVGAGQTLRFPKADLLPSDASHLAISGSTDCIVSAGYRANRDGASTSVTHEAAPIGNAFYVYPGEWNVLFDGVALINTGDSDANITLTQIGDDGQIKQTVTLTEALAPNAKYLGLFEGLIPEDANTIIKIESNQPLALLSLRLSKDGLYLYNNNPQ